jgi:tetratricopeptide (TPR) repeat protein
MLIQPFVRTLLQCIAACLVFFAASPRILNAVAQTSTEDEFAKVVEDPKAGTVVLQLASRRFVRPGQAGPVVTTYSMLHFADRSFFEKRQEQLDTNDVVLFERANPPGTGRREYSLHKDDEAAWNIATTKLRLQTLGLLSKAVEHFEKRLPERFEDLQAWDQRLASLRDSLAKDAWGNEFQFHAKETSLEIVSLGKDKSPGGEGEDADLLLSEQEEFPSVDFDRQSEASRIAKLIDLTFQGDAMVHEKPHWRSSDLSIDQVKERLKAQGVSDEIQSRTITWLPMQIMEPFLGLIQRMPNVKNTGRRLFIEMMAKFQPPRTNTSNTSGRDQVIIFDRNQLVINDLIGIIESEPSVRSVGIIYGGGHMPDIESRLRELGYREESVEWTDTITASLPKTVFEKAQWEWSRKAIRELMSDSNFEAEQHMQRGQAASDPEQALAEYHKEQTLREELVRKNPKNLDSSRWLALCYDRIAQSYLDRKQLDKALEFYRKGEKVRRSVAERKAKDAPSQRDLAFSCGKLADVLMEMGQMEEAMGFCQQGHDIYQRLIEADPNEDPKNIEWHTRQLAECYDRIARSYIEKKQFESALEYCQKSKTLVRSLVDREPKDAQSQRDLASGFSLQAYLFMQLGKTEEALECSLQGLEIVQRLAEADPNNTEDRETVEWYHTLIALCYDRIAESHFENKQFDKAMEFYQKEETLRRSSVDRNPKDITSLCGLAWCFGRRGVVSMESGNTKEAIEFFQKGLHIYQQLAEADPNDTWNQESITWYTDQIKGAKTNP